MKEIFERVKVPAAIGLILALLALAHPANAVTLLHLPNTGRVRTLFPEYRPNNKAIRQLIGQLKTQYASSSPEAMRIAEQLAAFGREVIPYMVELDGVRHWGLKGKGQIGAFRPYVYHAGAVISRIRDPSAIPNLKTIMFEPTLYRPARAALFGIDAPLSFAEAKEIIDFDRKHFNLRFINESQYQAIFRHLSRDEAAEAWLAVLHSATSDAHGLHQLSDDELSLAECAIAHLGQTGSPAAIQALNDQAATLLDSLEDLKRQAASPERMAFYSDTGKGRIISNRVLGERILAEYRKAIAKGAKEANRPVGVWKSLDDRKRDGQAYTKNYTVHFYLWSLTPEVLVTVSMRNLPITDIKGITWSNNRVHLKPGKELPYEDNLELIWDPHEEPYLREIPIKVTDQNGNVSVVKTYAKRWAE